MVVEKGVTTIGLTKDEIDTLAGAKDVLLDIYRNFVSVDEELWVADEYYSHRDLSTLIDLVCGLCEDGDVRILTS